MNDTPLSLYNTLTRQKEAFQPEDPANVRMYVCGPTVYDYAHIGNARPAIVFDVLFRLLRYIYGEDHVTYVRNITDVDDKINARALRDFPQLPLNDAIRKVTEKTANQYQKDTTALGCLAPTHQPRATEYIDGMVSMILTLIEKSHAYVAQTPDGGEVLFDVTSMAEYGRLSNRKLEDQKAGARIDVENHKKNPGDFVLWKLSSGDEPGWESPWGRGRPGWHIECSVMSEHHLGKVFDIHGGGLDLIFPHHENEIAQSCCAHGTEKMANVWMHNGFVQVEGKKMSKSDGNFITIHDLLHTTKFGSRKWPGEVLRLAMLMTHYREPIDFSVRRLEEAENALQKWAAATKGYSANTSTELSAIQAMFDDLNFSNLRAVFDKLAKQAKQGDISAGQELVSTLLYLGFDVSNLQSDVGTSMNDSAEIDMEVQSKIDQRLTHLANKDWAAADKIRDELAGDGIQLKDGKDPDTGERVTTWEVKR